MWVADDRLDDARAIVETWRTDSLVLAGCLDLGRLETTELPPPECPVEHGSLPVGSRRRFVGRVANRRRGESDGIFEAHAQPDTRP